MDFGAAAVAYQHSVYRSKYPSVVSVVDPSSALDRSEGNRVAVAVLLQRLFRIFFDAVVILDLKVSLVVFLKSLVDFD